MATGKDLDLTLKTAIQERFSENRNLIAVDFRSPSRKIEWQITYGELNALAESLARLLANLPPGPVAISAEKSLTLYAGVLASVYAERCFLPVSPQWAPAFAEKLVHDLQPQAMIGEPQAPDQPSEVKIPQFWVKADQKSIGHYLMPKTTGAGPSELSSDFRDLCYLILTSGSTGASKAIKISNANLISFINNFQQAAPLERQEKISQVFSLNFDPAIGEIFSCWSQGGCLCAFAQEDLFFFPNLIEHYQLSRWWSTPTTAKLVLKVLKSRSFKSFPTLRASAFVGEALTRSLALDWLQHFPNSQIHNTYGPTETTVVNAMQIFTAEQIRNFTHETLSMGRGFGDNRLSLVDSQGHTIQLPGEVGEITIHGHQVGCGYLSDQQGGFANGIFATGDLAFLTEDRDFVFVSRQAFDFKVMGERINLTELTGHFQRELRAEWLAVVPARDQDGLVYGIHLILSEKFSASVLASFLDRCRQLNTVKLIPQGIFYIDKIPLNLNNKTDYKKIESMVASAQLERML